MSKRPRLMAATALALTVLLAAAWMCYGLADRYFLQRLATQNETTLRLVASGLQGALLRYAPVPALLADKANIKDLLSSQAVQQDAQSVNEQLKQIAAGVGASDIYVMDKNGLTIAASNFDQDLSFIGQNFSYRPYFKEAIAGRQTRYFALGTTSLKRGYYFAAPVQIGGANAGVVAVKIGVDVLEQNWRGTDTEIIVSDDYGVVFMASQPGWLFKSLGPLSDEALASINTSQRYPPGDLSELRMRSVPSGLEGLSIMTISEGLGSQGTASRTFLESPRLMPDAGWRLHVLVPRSIATGQLYVSLAIAFLLLLIVSLIGAIVLQRRARLVRNIALQEEAKAELEDRVAERTNDLNDANRMLRQEVNERTQTEEQLRSTQNELIQAGKLAALGQMSAALSHELNQPLAAVKSYADNARTYLDRGNAEQAKANIGSISEMADRMAELGQHLRNFARKPGQKVGIVNLSDMFQSLTSIMSGRLRQSNAKLVIEPFDETLIANAGLVRLQQVLVNLINNALDAGSDEAGQAIIISVEPEADRIAIHVRDHGPGVNEAIIDEIFDPFFTTKGINEGLGLGLSISYNIIRDFGGRLSARNHSEGGAVFTISLERAEPVRSAAE